MSTYHKQATSRQGRQIPTQYRTQPPAHLVPDHGIPDGLAHHEPNQRWLRLAARPDQQMAGQQGAPSAGTATHRELELSTAAHPEFCRKHARPPPSRGVVQSGGGRGARGREEQRHTLTLARPFRRRAARTARPALVRMRSRNPCVLARRRLFGWNVRLLTGGSTYGVITGSQATRRASARQTARESLSRFTLRASLSTGQTSGTRDDRMPPMLAGGRNGRLPNAAWPARLGCGQPARPRGTGWREPATAVQRRPGHGAECGVHSLWIRLLIRMWGRKVNTR